VVVELDVLDQMAFIAPITKTTALLENVSWRFQNVDKHLVGAGTNHQQGRQGRQKYQECQIIVYSIFSWLVCLQYSRDLVGGRYQPPARATS